VERDLLFQVIQKDINSFDIETEISPVDLRYHRLNLSADSRRNLLLLQGLAGAGFSGTANAAELIGERPELLRTLPNFYPVQAARPCPQRCSICPYPRFFGEEDFFPGARDFMPKDRFEEVLEKIIAFSGDGVIDLSLWGELSLHPEKMELIRMVLARPALSLVIETSGLGWKPEELERLGEEAKNAPPRINRMAPLSWIVSLDARDPRRYQEVRGAGYAEAENRALRLGKLFPESCYVQAVRLKGYEDDIEQFYRYWKDNSPGGVNIIIQKYDDFCGFLPRLQASDLSPIKRRPCRHLLRDMPVLLDGAVPVCREDLGALNRRGSHPALGNIFSGSLAAIWSGGEALYREHCRGNYSGICADCDEYYTFNF
jgi:spiro-SPASM protein